MHNLSSADEDRVRYERCNTEQRQTQREKMRRRFFNERVQRQTSEGNADDEIMYRERELQ